MCAVCTVIALVESIHSKWRVFFFVFIYSPIVDAFETFDCNSHAIFFIFFVLAYLLIRWINFDANAEITHDHEKRWDIGVANDTEWISESQIDRNVLP